MDGHRYYSKYVDIKIKMSFATKCQGHLGTKPAENCVEIENDRKFGLILPPTDLQYTVLSTEN